MTVCEEHGSEPNDDSLQCYGELWRCKECHRIVCAGYGCADNEPELCDACWYLKRARNENLVL